MAYLIVALATFGVMFALDKGFTKIFRNQAQHHSGTAVRLRRGYGIAGVALCVIAVLCLMNYVTSREGIMLFCAIALAVMGAGLGAYYLTHGVFYDDESFLFTTLGKKGVTYRYADITGQKLYQLQGGGYLVDLYMTDGNNVGIQTTMPGAYDFLDKACHARFRQLGINSAECEWFDESKSCWFPNKED